MRIFFNFFNVIYIKFYSLIKETFFKNLNNVQWISDQSPSVNQLCSFLKRKKKKKEEELFALLNK